MNQLNSKLFMQTHSEAHDEPWLVSYADMMTLLFGFFVILYSFSTLDERKLSSVGEQVSQTFGGKKIIDQSRPAGLDEERLLRAVSMLSSLTGIGNSPETIVDQIERKFDQNQKIAKAEQEIKSEWKASDSTLKDALVSHRAGEGDQVIKIILQSSLLFQPNSSQLNRGMEQTIRKIAGKLQSAKDVLSIDVVGHSDARPVRADAGIDNWGLAAARATAVAQYLSTYGLSMKTMSIVSKGDQDPLFPSTDMRGRWIEENLKRNRRVEIIVRRSK